MTPGAPAAAFRSGLAGTLTAAVLILALVPAAEAQQADALAPALAEARALVDAGQAGEAISRLKALDVTNPRVAYLLGVAYYHADQHVLAIDTLRPLLDRLPADSAERREAEQVLGLSLYLAGRFPEALPFLERTRTWAAGNLQLNQVLGLTYIQLHRPDEARDAIARIFGVPAESAAARVLTAQMMIRLEMEALAEAELGRALEIDPRIPRAHYLLGQQAIFRGRLDEGIALTRRELDINPSDAMAYYQLGDALGRQLKWDESIAALQQSLWLNPFYSGPFILLAKAYVKKGQPSTAEGMLRKAIEYDPNNRTAHYMLAQVLQQLGRTEEAKREFEIADKLPGLRQ
jgi:tetratricopeptide (TPR) repeat protein